jgi:hypothetical protein
MLSAVVYGETLTNLAETISEEPVTIGHKQNFIPNEYIEYPVMATEGKMLMFEGNTLKNILPKNGNTPTLSTDGLPIIETDRNVDSSYSIKDGEMPSAVMNGLSLVNVRTDAGAAIHKCTKRSDHVDPVFHDGEDVHLVTNEIYTVFVVVTENNISDGHYISFNFKHSDNKYNGVASKGEYSINVPAKQTGVYKSCVCKHGNTCTLPARYWGNAFYGVYNDDGTQYNLTSSEYYTYGVVVLKGDYYDYDLQNHFTGIGSVKSPTLITQTKNLMITPPNGKVSTTGVSGKDVVATYNNGVWNFKGSITNTYATFNLINLDYAGGASTTAYENNFMSTNPQPFTRPDLHGAVTVSWKCTCSLANANPITMKALCTDGKTYNIANYVYDANKDVNSTLNLVTSPIVAIFITFVYGWDEFECNLYDFQVEYSTNGKTTGYTDYVPAKKTTIHTPKDLELRSTPKSKDVMDLNTGIVTRNVGVITSAELAANYNLQGGNEKGANTYFAKINLANLTMKSRDSICSGFPTFDIPAYNFEHNKNGEYDFEGIVTEGQYPCLRVLRSTIDAYGQSGFMNGMKMWLKDANLTLYYGNPSPTTEQIDLSDQPKPYAYKNGHISLSSDELTPTLDYQLPSSNVFEGVSQLKANTTYTLHYDGDVTSLVLGGKTINSPTSNMLVTSGSTGNNIVLNGTDIDNVMLIEGDVRGQDINYFTGVQTVEVSRILIQNQNQSQYIDLPQPVQLNRLSDGTCDTYNPITGEYVQRVGSKILNDGTEFYVNNTYNTDVINTLCFRGKNLIPNTLSEVTILSTIPSGARSDKPGIHYQWNSIILRISRKDLSTQDVDGLSQYLKNNPIPIFYALKEPVITKLTPININFNTEKQVTILTETNTVFPKTTITVPPMNKYDTTNWIPNAPITLKNATFVFINGSTTPTAAREVMSFTEEQLSSGSIVINDNGNGLIILNGDYTGRDIPYFTGMRSVEAIEIETTPSSDQPLFGKGGRK